MIKLEKESVYGWQEAIRGMRNPKNSWERSDSTYEPLIIGPNDLKLMKGLHDAGTDHRKFMRMIVVYVDITAPFYWWKEFDTYKIGTVADSCSTMHKIQAKEFTLDDFSTEHLIDPYKDLLQGTIDVLNNCRDDFNANGQKVDWWQMIQLLPTCYNQKRTVLMNYEVIARMYHARKNHKLDEWHTFCDWAETLPYSDLLIKGE